MNRIFLPKSLINKICNKELEKNYRNRLKKIKSSLSLNPPILSIPKDSNYFIKPIMTNRNFHLTHLNNFKKCLSSNNLEKTDETKNQISSRNKFRSIDLKIRMFNIAQNNLTMYKRLLECSNKSEYDKKKFINGYKKSQKYKKIKCEYPMIDFYKDKRISNFYFSLNKRKTNINSIFNNLDKYIKHKPININIHTNTYETLFFSNDIKKKYIAKNKKNKLFLNNLNEKTLHKKNENFKTFNSIFEECKDKTSEINKEKKNNDMGAIN